MASTAVATVATKEDTAEYVLPTNIGTIVPDSIYREMLSHPVGNQRLSGWLKGTLSLREGDVTNVIATSLLADKDADTVRFVAAAVLHASGINGALTAFGKAIPADNKEGHVSRSVVSKWARAGLVLTSGLQGDATPKQVLAACSLDGGAITKAIESRKPEVSVPAAIVRIRKAEAKRKKDAHANGGRKGETPTPEGGIVGKPDSKSPTTMQTVASTLSLLDAATLDAMTDAQLAGLATMLTKAGNSVAAIRDERKASKAKTVKPGPVSKAS